jgi:hypothetical protein
MAQMIQQQERRSASRGEIFRAIWEMADCGSVACGIPRVSRATIPYLTEPWYCCAEPTAEQAALV